MCDVSDLFARFDDLDVPGKKPRVAAIEPPPLVADPTWDEHPVVKYIKGEPVELFTIGDLAAALGRKPVTIRSWEDAGLFPVARYRSAPPKGEQVPGKQTKGKRYYTRAQIEVVLAAARDTRVLVDPRKADWKKFTRLIVDGWQRLG